MSEGSGQAAGRLREIRIRLEAITAALRSEETGDREAGDLAAEAAELAGRAAEEAAGALADPDRD